jgi:hypothetical protein
MISLEDFTALVDGGEVPLEGRVEICPRCSRSGIQRRTTFVHVQTTEIMGDGMLTVPRDCCRLPRQARTPSEAPSPAGSLKIPPVPGFRRPLGHAGHAGDEDR